MTEDEQPPQNGIDLSAAEDDDINKARPADIEQDMREMERRKRVEAIMGSKLFREELERIVDSARDSGFTGILQQLSDIVGVPNTRIGNIYKTSNCMVPINDIRGVESMGYGKGEKILRCKLAATFRLLDLYGYTQGLGAQITARLKVDQEVFLVNPYGLLYHEITASSLNKVDMQGQVVEQGTTNFGVNKNHFMLHSVVHAARPDIRCAIYIGCSPVVAVSSLKTGLLPLTKDACVLGEISTHAYSGSLDAEERDKLVRNLGPNSKVMLLSNHGALCCGETIEEAFNAAYHIVQACETQLKLLPVGVDNLVLIPEESRRVIYEQSRRPPEDLEKKFSAAVNTDDGPTDESAKDNGPTTSFVKIGGAPKWRVGGAEFEALMRMLDNAGFRTGYIYRYPLIKSEPPRPKNDVELPPAVSSLGYLLEEEEMFRQGIWKRGEIRKGGDRSRWLNSPNVYQKVEVLETGTPDPKKITKWVAEGSPTHSTPVRIEDPLQFVPVNTNPREFKRLQQQIKDNRRADKISAGPQSLILEGVTWDEANRIKDATVSSAGDHVVLMGAASKGIIQRGFQHNATVYKAPYAKNPFDNVTDDELNEYKRTVERKKKSIHGEYTDTDFSESEALSSLQTSGAQHTKQTTTTTTAAVSQSEPEDVSEHQVMRIETKQAPVPSQPEVVLSDALPTHNHESFYHLQLQQTEQQYHDKVYKIQRSSLLQAIQFALMAKKYAFLFDKTNKIECFSDVSTDLFMIHKIEIFPHYTYPVTDTSNNSTNSSNNQNKQNLDDSYPNNFHADIAKDSKRNSTKLQEGPSTTSQQVLSGSLTAPPYRTVSHYGFNYPLTYVPNITLHPATLLTDVELQRQKVINFIKSTTMSFAEHFENNETCIKEHSPKLEKSATFKCENDNGSFISVKEIQLEPRRRQHRSSKTSSTRLPSYNTTSNDEEHEMDVHSEHFSSLLSIGASYPAASNSHNEDHEQDTGHEHEHDQEQIDEQYVDSCFHSSSSTRQTGSDKLYRTYVLRNFIPQQQQQQQQQQQRSHSYDNEFQHKPESEQAIDVDAKNNSKSQKQQQKPIELTVNTLKRRSFRKSNTKASLHTQNNNNHQNCQATVSSPRKDAKGVTKSDTATNTSFKSIELHINISIKNADTAKHLETHENELKRKLERVIDDEINLISEQLIEQCNENFVEPNEVPKVTEDDDNCERIIPNTSGPKINNSYNNVYPMQTSISASAVQPSPMLHYRHTLSLLEYELENLLNSIIRSNELHNRAIMCDCKTKILQITQSIRGTLNVNKVQN